jgi:hypothetical protein
MKTLKYLLLTAAVVTCLSSGKLFSQETLKGSIQIIRSDKGSMTMAVIPVPTRGVPNQVKAIITKKVLQEKEKNKARFVFILPAEMQRPGPSFTVKDGNIIAPIGPVDPQKEQLTLFLVYKGAPTSEGKPTFSQQKVELTGNN